MSQLPAQVYYTPNGPPVLGPGTPPHTEPWAKYFWSRGTLLQRPLNKRLTAYLEHFGPMMFHRLERPGMACLFTPGTMDGSPLRITNRPPMESAGYSQQTMTTLVNQGVLCVWTEEVLDNGDRRVTTYGPVK